jgi:DNA-binding MarR family transcriptional regulator
MRRPDLDVLEATAWLTVDATLRTLRLVAGALTLAQFRLLAALSEAGEAPVPRLARAMRASPAIVARWSDRLVALGFATRSPQGLAVTPAGQQVVARVSHRLRQELAALLGGADDDRLAGLVDALDGLLEDHRVRSRP